VNVLFCIPTFNSKARYHPGLASLSAVLKTRGHHTSLLSPDALDYDLIKKKIEDFSPGLLVISTNSHQYEHARDIIDFVKESHIKTIVGGVHSTLHPDLIYELKKVDAVCKGEGEGPLLEYVESLESGREHYDIPNIDFRVGDKVITNAVTYYVKDLDSLPFPDYSIFPLFKEGERLSFPMRFFFNRGCPFDCTYCCNHKLKELFPQRNEYVRFKSPKRVIEEILYFSDKYQFEEYVIDDDIFTLNKNWLGELCRSFPDKLKNKTFEANIRIGTVDRQILRALKDIGCSCLHMGLESGSDQLREKVLGRPISKQQIIETARMVKSVGLKLHTYNMIGIPGETRHDVWETIKLNRFVTPDKMQVTVFYPYKNTVLGDYCYKCDLVSMESADTYFTESILKKVAVGFSKMEIAHYVYFFKFYVNVGINNRAAWSALIGGLKKTSWTIKATISSWLKFCRGFGRRLSKRDVSNQVTLGFDAEEDAE
jgi:anaerobic magnesium-protoporphyrin IX monomethyl ester cyclase